MNNFIVYCARVFIPKVLERGRFVCSDELSYTPIAGKPEDRNDPQRRGSSGNHPAVARPDETVSRIQCEMPRYHENSCFTPLESNFESSTMSRPCSVASRNHPACIAPNFIARKSHLDKNWWSCRRQ